jgi:D-ribose pyranose/furanose isomerase RbsD
MFANGSAVPVVPEHIRRVDSVASAVHHVLERVDVMSAQGPIKAYVLASNVYHKTAQGWRMVLHHASPGTASDAQDASQSPQVLH